MQLIPEDQRPVSGTVGALRRRRNLLTQLPVYDQDPMKCQSLGSEEEVEHAVVTCGGAVLSSWSFDLFSTSCRFLPCCSS